MSNKDQATANRWKQSPQAIIAVVVCLPLVAMAVYFSSREPLDAPHQDEGGPILERARTVQVGGVNRPASDLRTSSTSHRSDGEEVSNRLSYGTVPRLQPDANPSVRSVDQALRSGEQPERLSPAFTPKPFDLQSYQADPQAYLEVHEPGRVWQSAQPGDGVPVIERVGKTKHAIRQGESVRLAVRTTARMPVTFTSFDGGAFGSGLTSMSVAADDDGVAEVAFTGTSGTMGEINIIAASPVAAERVNFQVYVARPLAGSGDSGK